MLMLKILAAWLALSLLFVWGWSRWQARMAKYDGEK